MMTKTEIFNKLKTVNGIYGFAHGTRYIYDIHLQKTRIDDIIFINMNQLEQMTSTAFKYQWGLTYNVYTVSDYEITWAFTKEELIRGVSI